MRKWLILAAALAALGCWLIATAPAQGHHIFPPILPGLCGQDVSICPTPLIQKAKTGATLTYRLDAGTSSYPGFRLQAAQVADAWTTALGVEAIEVTTGIPYIWLTFPDDQTFINICGNGAAACIQYWSDPVMVFFRRALLYNDWKTTLSHEGINGGHALGLHERYNDIDFICIPNPKPPSVMSCGSGIWQPQPFDIEWTCYVVDREGAFLEGCGFQPVQEYPYWDSERWIFEDGWSFKPDAGCGEWHDPLNRLVWGVCDSSWGGRWNALIQIWTNGSSTYHPVSDSWFAGGLVLP